MKAQLLQVGMQHAQALKDTAAAGEAKVEEVKKQLADAEEQLHRELDEERNLLKLEQEKNRELSAHHASLSQMIKDTDAKALSTCSYPLLISFIFLPVYSHAGFF
jgi:ABC-type transporter Mla subunit MlaD